MARLAKIRLLYCILLLLILSACNLSNSPEQQLALTEMPTNTSAPTRTSISGVSGVPTTLPITQVAPPTSQSLVLPPTSNSIPPTFRPFPTNTPTPISIVILSPIPGNVVAGNVQVLGAAIHPLFLQYQLEYGPDPNPGNLWYPATGISQNSVFNGLLGIWNTTQVQDSVYQLRLRVTLRDGTSLATVVNNIRVQNQAPTPIPSATPNIPRPIAAFTQDRTTGQAPLVVRFINQSSGSITNFTWTFGDGGSSAEANPVYTFRAPGVYYVTLGVNGPGGTSNVTQQINVQSPSAPVAAFTQDTTSGSSPLTVKFANQSTGNITSINWAFGDGTTSAEPNPTHQFTAVGTYNVILSIVGPGGTSFVTRKITVQDPVVPPPIAIFAPDKVSGNIPLQVQFANQSTGQITSYAWDFGDGQTSVDKNPVHTFAAAGEFTVKLTVIGPGGQNSAQTKITAIKPPDAPLAAFTQNTTAGNAPLAVQFTNQSSGNVTSYSWDFGDGSPLSTEKDPSHSYVTVGTYTVKMKVTGPGGTSEAQSTITATKPVEAPVSAFVVTPPTGTAPLNVQFTNQSTGESLTYSWEFGDGTTSSDANPTHTYSAADTYTAKLTVTNSAGSNSSQQTVTVTTAPVAPVASFTADPTTGNAPLTVTFVSTSIGDFNTYAWAFVDANGATLGTADTANTSFQFPNAGTYTVTLAVSGLGGSDTSDPQTITVNATPVAPIASFTTDTTTGNAPLTVNFTSTSTGDGLTYAWNFGDGTTASDANSSHEYTQAGTYNVTLTVTNAGGNNISAPQTITVNAAAVAPVASFTADPTTGNAPLTVNFTSTSTGDGLTYAWNFGDGTTASDANSSHEYTQAGTYNVTLTVTNAGGNNISAPQTITVNTAAVAPVASFTTDTTTGNAPLTVNFTSTSTGDGLTYAWVFVDANGATLGTADTANTSFQFPNAGTYTVTLAVSGLGGSDTSDPQTITVNATPVAPIASFTTDTTTGDAPLTVNFTSTSTGDFNTYAWAFVDANGATLGTADTANTSFQFLNAGTYTVTLAVSGLGGSDTSDPQTITVNAAAVAPVASFTADPTTGNAPLTVNFTSTSTGDGLTYAWNFGDGTTASDANSSHEYTQAGTYNVTLTVTNAGGTNISAPQTITVNAAPVAPVASFTTDTTTGDAPLTVNFTSTSTGDFNTYAWAFVDANGATLGTADTANTSFQFLNAGTYTVTLAVSGLGGSDTSDPQTITVNTAAVAPVASFTADPTTGDAPLTVNFTSTSTGDFNTYAWAFVDANGATLGTADTANTSFQFPNAGTYTVTLAVSGLGGSDTSDPQTITVNTAAVVPVPPPINDAVVFVSNRSGNDEIYLMTTDGTLTNLTNNPASDTNPSASPDGGRIAFVSNRDGNDEIYDMNSDGSNVVRVTDNPATDTTPVWSENGSLIVFASSRDGNYEIYAINPDGSNPINLTNAPSNETYPAPSPDGARLAYMSDRDGNNEVYVQATDGSIVNISNSPASIDASPTWSPNSSQIAFVSDREGAAQIYVANADGSNVSRVSDLSRPDTRPNWSPDGTQILFVSQDNGLSQIYVMNTDGSGVAKVSDGTSNDSASSWVP